MMKMPFPSTHPQVKKNSRGAEGLSKNDEEQTMARVTPDDSEKQSD